jgi:hypothetical protein
MGEKAATKDVIDALVKALEDQNSDGKREACKALGNMGEKAATKDVIDALVKALANQNSGVRNEAFEALGKMGEKAATKDVINVLLIAKNSAGYWSGFNTVLDTVLEKNLVSCLTMSLLDSQTVSNLLLYLSQDEWFLLNGISIDKFIKAYRDTGIVEWTSVVTLLSLRRGCAITISENTIIVYGNEDPVPIPVSMSILRERLVEAFSDQISRLYLPSEQQSEYEHGLKVTSAVCNIM